MEETKRTKSSDEQPTCGQGLAAHEHLVSEYTAIAARLASTAKRMRGYRDLPAAPHHEEALGEPKLLDMFERFVTLEGELAQLLSESAERDGQFLQQARSEEA